MPPRPDVSAERTEQIHQAALTCFARKGYHLTTMDDIAAESGLSKGALYWYFKSKKELFLSLFQASIAQMGQSWEKIAADQSASASEKLTASTALFRTELKELAPFFGIMIEAWALTRHDEDVESLMAASYTPFLKIMTDILEQGIRSREFRVRSKEATALIIMTLYDGITLAVATGLWQADWGQVMDAAEDLVLGGLGVNRG